MADYLPRYKPGHTPNTLLTTDVKGGQLLEVTGNKTSGVAGAGSLKVIGVAGPDAKAGQTIAYHKGGIQRLKIVGAVAAGDPLQPAADGAATKGNAPLIAIALEAGVDGQVIDADARF